LIGLVGIALATIGLPVGAEPCAGFADVDSTSTFCPNVEWLKNRAITLGCDAGLYCPSEPVSRLAMAAFMNRLGTALTPAELHKSVVYNQLIDLDQPGTGGTTGPIVCLSDPYAIPATGFPRYASVDGTIAARFNASAESCVNLYYSSNAGTSWNPINDCNMVIGAPAANLGASATTIGQRVELEPGLTYRFALALERNEGSGDPILSVCSLRVTIYNRNGGTPPYDR
jgi:hypothetical protein